MIDKEQIFQERLRRYNRDFVRKYGRIEQWSGTKEEYHAARKNYVLSRFHHPARRVRLPDKI